VLYLAPTEHVSAMMHERASRADPDAVMQILQKIPDIDPELGDEIRVWC
jgi:hypothetical protein